MHLLRDPSCIFLDRRNTLTTQVPGRNDAGRIPGMHACQLNMLHNCRNKSMNPIADCIGFTLGRMHQETVDQNRTIRCYADGRFHISDHAFLIINNLHASSAKHVGRTHHHRISDLFRNRQRVIHRNCHPGFRHRNLQLFHHCAELVPVLSKVDHRRRGSKDLHPVFLQIRSQIQRSLSAELRDHSDRFFLRVNAQNILKRQRLKIQFIRSIIVCRDCLRVAVYNYRLKSKLFERQCCMHAAVVKLDSLPDPVWSAA